MPIVKIEKNKNYSYVLWFIDELTNSLLKELKPNNSELKDLKNIRHRVRKRQNIVARLILNHLANRKVELCYFKNGLPYCSNFKYISISHSKNYCVVITSKSPIGIDVQYKKKNIDVLSSKFVNNTEKIIIDVDNKTDQLHFIWCAKEAIYKTLNGKPCSFKRNIYIEQVSNRKKTNAYYKCKNQVIKYEIYCELFENYFIAIAN